MALARPLRAVIFDFDGVIVESLQIKTDAFAQLFADRPDHVEQVVRLHTENQGLSRYDKFVIIYRDFLREPLTDAERDRLDRELSALVFERVVSCNLVRGARELLERLGRDVPLYVASATPQEELQRIVQARDLAALFTGVHGSPRGKAEIIASIVADGAATATVVVGDALSDHRAAQANDVAFVGRVPPGELDPFSGLGVPTVADLAELDARWDELLDALVSASGASPRVTQSHA